MIALEPMSKHFPSTITTIGDLSADFTVSDAAGLKPAAKPEVVKRKEVRRVEIVFILFLF
jgi:hypothetical protein